MLLIVCLLMIHSPISMALQEIFAERNAQSSLGDHSFELDISKNCSTGTGTGHKFREFQFLFGPETKIQTLPLITLMALISTDSKDFDLKSAASVFIRG